MEELVGQKGALGSGQMHPKAAVSLAMQMPKFRHRAMPMQGTCHSPPARLGEVPQSWHLDPSKRRTEMGILVRLCPASHAWFCWSVPGFIFTLDTEE